MSVVLIHCDSTTTIAKIENCYYNGKIHQIRRKHNTIRHCIFKGAVRVDRVRTNENLVDLLMKGLASEKVQNTLKKMRLTPIEKSVARDGNPT